MLLLFIIPIYNTQSYLDECLHSLFQDFDNFVAILINDGSTDESIKIAQKYTQRDSRFILINQENQGLSQARNKALDYIYSHYSDKNGYVLFLDSDDFISPSMMSYLHQTLKNQKNKIDVLRYNYKFYPSGICPKSGKNKYYEDGIEFILQNPDVLGEGCVWMYAFSLNFLLKHELTFIPDIYFEDMTFILDALLYAKGVVENDQILYFYRIRQGSIMNSKWDFPRTKKALESYVAIMNHHKNLLNSLNINSKENKQKHLTLTSNPAEGKTPNKPIAIRPARVQNLTEKQRTRLQKILRDRISVYLYEFSNKANNIKFPLTEKLKQDFKEFLKLAPRHIIFRTKYPKLFKLSQLAKRILLSLLRRIKGRNA